MEYRIVNRKTTERAKSYGADYKKYVLVTSEEQEAIDFVVRNAPPAKSQLLRLKSLGILP